MASAGGRTMGGKAGRTGRGDYGGKVRRPEWKGEDKRMDERGGACDERIGRW